MLCGLSEGREGIREMDIRNVMHEKEMPAE